MNTFNHRSYPLKDLLFSSIVALSMSIDTVSARTIASQVNMSSGNSIDQSPKSVDLNDMIIMDDSNNSGDGDTANKENNARPCIATHDCDNGADIENQRVERQQK
ncbi:MAG: hypothetical protein EPN89_15125 [Methylovulum sp.]|nr:MAG: hypothetical protein EPN89_15125 [Methylovulum sp.]